MSSTDNPNITNVMTQVEYRLEHTRTTAAGVLVEYDSPGVTSVAVMAEYLELDVIPLLAVGQYYGGS
jgi:hypothetical protein